MLYDSLTSSFNYVFVRSAPEVEEDGTQVESELLASLFGLLVLPLRKGCSQPHLVSGRRAVNHFEDQHMAVTSSGHSQPGLKL